MIRKERQLILFQFCRLIVVVVSPFVCVSMEYLFKRIWLFLHLLYMITCLIVIADVTQQLMELF